MTGFWLGYMLGVLTAAFASRVAGPAPDFVFIVGGGALLVSGVLWVVLR